MADPLTRLRVACAQVADRARYVKINRDAIPAYASSLPLATVPRRPDPEEGSREQRAAFCLTLDAINFGSGWFPTLRKRSGHSGYFTIEAGVREHGAWSASELASLTAAEVAVALGQDPGHELMGLFAESLNDLGRHISDGFNGRFAAVVDAAGHEAINLVERLSDWGCFADTSTYDELELPFLKRAQIAAADLCDAGVLEASDLARLTMFADNLVPHVLRLDGVLHFEPELLERIVREELIQHGSGEEVEIRACALHAVELIAQARPGAVPAEVDKLLWNRGQQRRYKAAPRHRSRCTAY
jgi:hypothetical protein